MSYRMRLHFLGEAPCSLSSLIYYFEFSAKNIDMNPMVEHLKYQAEEFKVQSLEQYCPIELSAMMKMFSICVVQYGSHYLHVAFQHLKCGQWG